MSTLKLGHFFLKIIRDMKQMENGVGLSKQFGFVAFNKHEDALGNN